MITDPGYYHRELFSFPVASYVVITIVLPMVSMAVCAYLTGTRDTKIPCDIIFKHDRRYPYNVVPNISSVSGHYFPQVVISRILHGVTTTYAILEMLLYHRHFSTLLLVREINNTRRYQRARRVVKLMVVCRAMEALGTHGLITVSNREYFPLHCAMSVFYMVGSYLYLPSHIYLNYMFHQKTVSSQEMSQTRCMPAPWSMRYKLAWCTVYTVCCSIDMVTFIMHELFCFDHMYTIFAIAEYVAVAARLIFGYSISADFRGMRLVVRPLPASDENGQSGLKRIRLHRANIHNV